VARQQQVPKDEVRNQPEGALPSKVEGIKSNSRHLRGSLAVELARPTERFGDEDEQVLKFHGVYQQDDRDLRALRRRGGGDKLTIFMIRSKIPGGVLTADQYLAHDRFATEYANGTLRLTTRQDIQLHGVLKQSLKAILQGLHETGVTSFGACGDVERNVMCCPAPLQDDVRSEVQRYARILSDRLLPQSRAYQEVWLDSEQVARVGADETEPLYGDTYLPRKFKTGIAFPEDNCIDVYSQDVGIVPVVERGQLWGFDVLVGGGMGMTHKMPETFPRLASPLAFVAAERLADVVEGIVAVQRDYGDRSNRKHARLKYLVADRGVDWFKAELERLLGYQLQAAVPLASWDVDDHLGWHPQGDGRFFLGVHVENGRVQDDERSKTKSAFRLVAERFRPGVRITPQQSILFTDIAGADRAALDAVLADHGIRPLADLSNARRFAMACPALPTCGLAMTDAERALPEVLTGIEAELDRLGLRDARLTVRMTGCPNGCTRPYLGDIGLVGRTLNAYNIYLGGDFEGTRLNELYCELVPKDRIVETITPLLAAYKLGRRGDEGFGEFCHRVGVPQLIRLLGVTQAA